MIAAHLIIALALWVAPGSAAHGGACDGGARQPITFTGVDHENSTETPTWYGTVRINGGTVLPLYFNGGNTATIEVSPSESGSATALIYETWPSDVHVPPSSVTISFVKCEQPTTTTTSTTQPTTTTSTTTTTTIVVPSTTTSTTRPPVSSTTTSTTEPASTTTTTTLPHVVPPSSVPPSRGPSNGKGPVPPPTPTDSVPASSSGGLAMTGSHTWDMVLIAIALLGGGLAALVVGRWEDNRKGTR